MVKLLFVQGGTRVKRDESGNWYSDTNFNNAIWQRYKSYCDELIVLLRCENKIYSQDEALEKFNPIDNRLVKLITVPDLYRPLKNVINIELKKTIKKSIAEAVKAADKVIIRSVNNFYTITTLKYCKCFKKPYLIEVAGACWEGFWYHSLRGKFVAYKREHDCVKFLKDAPYAIYVTEEALQRRYPCNGKTLGCSDVELAPLNDKLLKMRLEKIELRKPDEKLILGTAAALDVKWKGQVTVFKALAEFKKKGCTNFEYQLIGAGNREYLLTEAKKLKIEDCVNIIGPLPHDKVAQWLQQIDVYIQPSFQEGLCRSIVEAMSQACPVICSDVGGNYELVSTEALFKRGNIKEICEKLQLFSDSVVLIRNAKQGFLRAKDFDKKILDNKRNEFYMDFCGKQVVKRG